MLTTLQWRCNLCGCGGDRCTCIAPDEERFVCEDCTFASGNPDSKCRYCGHDVIVSNKTGKATNEVPERFDKYADMYIASRLSKITDDVLFNGTRITELVVKASMFSKAVREERLKFFGTTGDNDAE